MIVDLYSGEPVEEGATYQGDCPYCKGNNLDYGTMEIDWEYAFYPRTCCDCWAEWEERYYLEFSEQVLTHKWHKKKKKEGFKS